MPVEFCRIPRNWYWFRKSNEPVMVIAPGLGSAVAASCAHAGVLARTIVVHVAAASASAFFRTRDVESIHLLRIRPRIDNSNPGHVVACIRFRARKCYTSLRAGLRTGCTEGAADDGSKIEAPVACM